MERTESAIGLAGPERLAGKAVIDVTNPLLFGGGGPPTPALAGDDSGGEQMVDPTSGAKATVTDAFGWESVDLGGIERSRYLEPPAMVWIVHATGAAGANHAFKLLRK